MSDVQWPFSFARLNRRALDASAVFNTLAAFQSYLSSGPAFAGQIVVVRNGTNIPDLFRINEDFTYKEITGDVANVSVGSANPPATPDPGALWTTADGEIFIWRDDMWFQIG